jgi:AmiR/NasT family two-component response regulator
MRTIHVLLVDSNGSVKKQLEHGLVNAHALEFHVTARTVSAARSGVDRLGNDYDVVFFGEKVPREQVVELASLFRSKTITAPILSLTKESEAKLPEELASAGVDDMFNLAEMTTPLFSWTFVSVLEQIEVRKKAKDYDILQARLDAVDKAFSERIHGVNTPLSVMKLAIAHLLKADLPPEKLATYCGFIATSLEKLEAQILELRKLRRQVTDDSHAVSKILSSRAVRKLVCSR